MRSEDYLFGWIITLGTVMEIRRRKVTVGADVLSKTRERNNLMAVIFFFWRDANGTDRARLTPRGSGYIYMYMPLGKEDVYVGQKFNHSSEKHAHPLAPSSQPGPLPTYLPPRPTASPPVSPHPSPAYQSRRPRPGNSRRAEYKFFS